MIIAINILVKIFFSQENSVLCNLFHGKYFWRREREKGTAKGFELPAPRVLKLTHRPIKNTTFLFADRFSKFLLPLKAVEKEKLFLNFNVCLLLRS